MLKKGVAFLLIIFPFGVAHAQMGEMLSPKCKILFEHMNKMEENIRKFYEERNKDLPGGYQGKNLSPSLYNPVEQSYQEVGIHNALALQWQKLNVAISEMKSTLDASESAEAIFADWDAISENLNQNCGNLEKLEPFKGIKQ